MRPGLRSIAVSWICTATLCVPALRAQEAKPAAKPKRAAVHATTAPAHNFAKWEREISNYERADAKQMPPKGGIVFIGSSTVVRWKTLATDFPNHVVINRGFGGSEIVDATHFADRIVFPYEPKQVFLRSGGNDLNAGKTPEQVFEDYKDFVRTVHRRLPKTQIVFISTCPAPSRWSQREATRKMNQLVKGFIEEHTKSDARPLLRYVEVYDITVGPDGEARENLFVKDRLHLNEQGYKLLADRVRPYLLDEAKK